MLVKSQRERRIFVAGERIQLLAHGGVAATAVRLARALPMLFTQIINRMFVGKTERRIG
jgi:hypothetical protein